jgi:hypothetical protein
VVPLRTDLDGVHLRGIREGLAEDGEQARQRVPIEGVEIGDQVEPWQHVDLTSFAGMTRSRFDGRGGISPISARCIGLPCGCGGP